MVLSKVVSSTTSNPLFSPLLCADDLIHQLEASNYMAVMYLVNLFFVLWMQMADDLLLLSASVTGLQQMLYICHSFAQFNDIIFNPKNVYVWSGTKYCIK